MNGEILDDFAQLTGWSPITSGQARLELSQELLPEGHAMRLDFDFQGGGGFVVARKEFALPLPESYAFSLRIRGAAPANILEFKLVDASGLNVWRYRREAFEVPAAWETLIIKSSQVEFAWGPAGGGPATSVATIELVIAAGPGGRGSVSIADLRHADTSYRLTPEVSASSELPGHAARHVCDPSPSTAWRSEASAGPQRLVVDFRQEREFGGLVIYWEEDLRPLDLDLAVSPDGSAWREAYAVRGGVGARSYFYLPDTKARLVRLDLRGAGGQGVGIVAIDVKPFDFSRSVNDFFEAIAQETARGLYPKYLVREQTYWTPIGTGHDVTQALMNEEGMVEVDKGSFSVEPFLFADGRLVTWADVSRSQGLEQEYLPIPSSQWNGDGVSLRITACATGESGQSALYIRYRVENSSGDVRSLSLFAAIRPFQVTPTWQHWQDYGGVRGIAELERDDFGVRVDGKRVAPLTPPNGFGASGFFQGDISDFLRRGELPSSTRVRDDFGFASGALRWDLRLAPGEAQDVFLAVPFGAVAAADSGAEQFERAAVQWRETLGAFDIQLPHAARAVVHTLKTAAAHILINRRGAALQPGPRRYDRSWIRDGALMGAALLRMGDHLAMRDFLRWYAGYQTEDGNLPDCVDRDGCEWLPEYDGWGELIFAVADYFRFTKDLAFVAEMWPFVAKSVAFMEGLRALRLTPEYRTAEKIACYGLLPESMSHEGYMAHPVHAYWDDFWALRGFRDARLLAEARGDETEAQRLEALSASFGETLHASLETVIRDRQLKFLPGSVEFADFDPAASAIAIEPLDQLHHLPRDIVDLTFDRYMEGFRQRVRGDVEWSNYSAYEIRIIGSLVRLGRREEAHELLDFFLADRRIVPWNQWPEISWRDPKGPSFIGDMPHSWISAEYVRAVRSLFAYERDEDQSLVLAAGVARQWLENGAEVAVTNLPTHFGPLSYRLQWNDANDLRLAIGATLTMPAGGIVIMPPLPGPPKSLEINGTPMDAATLVCHELPAEVLIRC